MMPESIRAESQVSIHDSCNSCCCFNFKRHDTKPVRRRKTVKKTANQADKIPKQESPRKVERHVTQIHLDITQTQDDGVVIDYKVGPDKE